MTPCGIYYLFSFIISSFREESNRNEQRIVWDSFALLQTGRLMPNSSRNMKHKSIMINMFLSVLFGIQLVKFEFEKFGIIDTQ